MPVTNVPNVCTMIWPFNKERECDGWLIGWNPRALIIVIVAIVQSPTIDSVMEVVEQLKKCEESARATAYHRHHKDIPKAASLLVLGRLRRRRPLEGADDEEHEKARVCAHRRIVDLWLELDNELVVSELWCCGYRVQPCHLHVIRVDHSSSYAVTSTVFSAVARYNRGDILKMVKGELKPIGVDGSDSPPENVPPSPSIVDSAGLRTNAKPTAHSEWLSKGGDCDMLRDDMKNMTDAHREGSRPRRANGTNGLEGVYNGPDASCSGNNRMLYPRLDSPSSADYGELGFLLRSSAYGKLLWECRESGDGGAGEGHFGAHAAHLESWKNRCLNALIDVQIQVLLVLLFMLKLPARVLYTAALLELRFRTMVHWLLMLRGGTSVCSLHPVLPHVQHEDPSMQRFCVFDFFVRFLVDGICGVLLSLLLSHNRSVFVSKAVSLCRWLLCDFHMGYMDWFEGWPAGLKMNEDLSMTLSFVAKFVLQKFWVSMENCDCVAQLYRILICVAPFGASCAFAFAADLCMITCHLQLVFRAVSLPRRVASSMLKSLFLQFQGKKYNPLRQRIDIYDFPVEQMLAATVIFTIVVFLIPTLAVYHVYFTLSCIFIWLVQGALLVAAHITSYVPLYPVLYWALHRHQWPGGVELIGPKLSQTHKHTEAASGSPTVEFTVRSKPLELRVLLADFLLVVHVLKGFHPFYMIVAVFSSKPWEPAILGGRLAPPLDKKLCCGSMTLSPHCGAEGMQRR